MIADAVMLRRHQEGLNVSFRRIRLFELVTRHKALRIEKPVREVSAARWVDVVALHVETHPARLKLCVVDQPPVRPSALGKWYATIHEVALERLFDNDPNRNTQQAPTDAPIAH